MDIERGLLAASLREGFPALRSITEDMFQGDAKQAFLFIKEYFYSYGKMPSYKLLMEETNIDVMTGVTQQEPSQFFRNQMIEYHLWKKGKDILEKAAILIETQAPIMQLKQMLATMVFSTLVHPDQDVSIPRSIFGSPELLLEDYEKASRVGITGIETPWPTMNRMTMGWQPEEFILIVARPGSGKTWLLIICLLHAWANGHKVVLFSTEMSFAALARRTYALFARLPYGLIKAGRLSPKEFEHFKSVMSDVKNDDRFLLVGNDTTLVRSTIEENLSLHKPDIAGIDGYYMVEDDVERPNAEELKKGAIWRSGKRIAKKYKVPLLVTHQLNRPDKQGQSAQNTKPDLTRLAHSDATGQYADYVFALRQTEEMAHDRKMTIIPLKARDAEEKHEIEIKWDLKNAEYHEIEKEKVIISGDEVSVFAPPPSQTDDLPF